MNKRVLNSASKTQCGFTLVEVLLVVVILAVISSIAIPKVAGSGDKARVNADIATARQVQAALDRYQVENGLYPKNGELIVDDKGTVTDNSTESPSGTFKFIPDYISKLDSTVTQQRVEKTGLKKGFGITSEELSKNSSDSLIMIYLTSDGSKAEVRAYRGKDGKQIWPEELEAGTEET